MFYDKGQKLRDMKNLTQKKYDNFDKLFSLYILEINEYDRPK